ncbi:Calcium-binding EF-hand domain-containing protein [Penicillium ucsense]|uniref:Calcium-binding EF-hand domain-containing protein n=1 Tax=Penicillium ucsense TaxID=2839758 RepID=A0A8J8WGJ9_9EURO|nr:Calcium-binding EF-hand domain-containing protein [Penicillium ucsense]KAF7729390.1 Calcium-binding EF-hand domain-containing protein [Penicillium ucsense]
MTQSSAPTFKPSPLSFGGPRASPFRRPSTPNSPPNAPRTGGTPGSSPTRGFTPMQSPSKLNQIYTAEEDNNAVASQKSEPIPQPKFTRELPSSPTKGARSPTHQVPILRSQPITTSTANGGSADAASRLPANQVREIREAFQVLDRDNDGLVSKDDVADVLSNIGQDASPSTLSRFFPDPSAQSINFPTFLNTLSQLMSPISPSQELINALAAFDDDDNGQIDVAELRDALLHTLPEDGEASLTRQQIDDVLTGFTGRRAFGGRNAKVGTVKRGEVFHYHDFVRSAVGGGENGNSARGETKIVGA